jgi:hypothetical protein
MKTASRRNGVAAKVDDDAFEEGAHFRVSLAGASVLFGNKRVISGIQFVDRALEYSVQAASAPPALVNSPCTVTSLLHLRRMQSR